MKRLVYALPGNHDFADLLALRGRWERRALSMHRFPDEETLITVAEPEHGGQVMLVCTLDRPDAKVVPLLMAAATLRELGASYITLVAPYLCYMRQDMRFRDGEAVSSEIFGRLLAHYVDSVVTVEPHLHRHHTLQDTGLPHGIVVSAATAIAAWIRAHVLRPLVIGPDQESAPWTEQIGRLTQAPTMVGYKVRRDDTHVGIDFADVDNTWLQRTPVIIDDIASSGHTMAECVSQLTRMGLPPPTCIAVHGICGPDARKRILDAGATRILFTNSVDHRNAQIDVSGCIVNAILEADALPAALRDRAH